MNKKNTALAFTRLMGRDYNLNYHLTMEPWKEGGAEILVGISHWLA